MIKRHMYRKLIVSQYWQKILTVMLTIHQSLQSFNITNARKVCGRIFAAVQNWKMQQYNMISNKICCSNCKDKMLSELESKKCNAIIKNAAKLKVPTFLVGCLIEI